MLSYFKVPHPISMSVIACHTICWPKCHNRLKRKRQVLFSNKIRKISQIPFRVSLTVLNFKWVLWLWYHGGWCAQAFSTFAGSFGVSLFIEWGGAEDLGECSSSFMIIRWWSVSWFVQQWRHFADVSVTSFYRLHFTTSRDSMHADYVHDVIFIGLDFTLCIWYRCVVIQTAPCLCTVE